MDEGQKSILDVIKLSVLFHLQKHAEKQSKVQESNYSSNHDNLFITTLSLAIAQSKNNNGSQIRH